ncbi:MAG TPA: monovalent cation/H(+) antiporter subunit G [Geminicoccaceae bacterium]|nr:monovalent cation/H(+) antiporter subunit G [Geminicoccaceae bacterium]
MIASLLSIPLIVAGALFILAGTVGLLRFPDVYTRLHALTKADNVGLGLIVLGLALQAEGWTVVLKLVLVWLLALLAAATVSQLMAGAALRAGIGVWRRPP